MGDTKRGREKQTADEERRQRERELAEALERVDEPEPIADADGELGELDGALENHDYPTTTAEVIAAYGSRVVETQGRWKPIDSILEPIDDERYDSPDDVRSRILELLNRG